MGNCTWQVSTHSVLGASHIRQGLPNQDACIQNSSQTQQLPVIMAVADGHGSKKCFRSERGSRLAVEQALAVMQDFISSQPKRGSVLKQAEEILSERLVQQWRRVVYDDVRKYPFSADEQLLLPSNQEPYLAYGSTLLVAVITDDFVLLMQLGDGDILQVQPDGTVQRPIAVDATLIANETTSLCTNNAWRQFRCSVQAMPSDAPMLWLLATDGYANSFANTASFEQVGTDLLAMIQEAGFAAVSQQLPDWLQVASQQGSGDDVTVALAYKQVKPPRYVVPNRRPVATRQRLLPRMPVRPRKEHLSKRTQRNMVELSQLFTRLLQND